MINYASDGACYKSKEIIVLANWMFNDNGGRHTKIRNIQSLRYAYQLGVL